MRMYVWIAGVGAALTLGTSTTAQEPNPLSPPAVRSAMLFREPLLPDTGAVRTEITGVVIDVRDLPVPRARVRLRDLNRGTIDQETITDDNGEYAFDILEPGTFAVEMVRLDGDVLAVSNAVTVARFETLRTVVRLQGRWTGNELQVSRLQRAADFIGMGAAVTMTAGTMQLAYELRIPPADSGEPVSAFQSR